MTSPHTTLVASSSGAFSPVTSSRGTSHENRQSQRTSPGRAKLVEKWTKHGLREMLKREHEITNFRGKQVVLKDLQAGLAVYVKAKASGATVDAVRSDRRS